MSELAVGKGIVTSHYAVSVQRMGLSGLKNGELLALAERNRFDLFPTRDRNLAFQRNTTQFRLAVVVLEAPGIQLHQTLPLMPQVPALLSSLRPGQVVRVGPSTGVGA